MSTLYDVPQIPQDQVLRFLDTTSDLWSPFRGYLGNLNVQVNAWQPSTLSFQPLTVDASGNLNTTGSGGGGGSVTVTNVVAIKAQTMAGNAPAGTTSLTSGGGTLVAANASRKGLYITVVGPSGAVVSLGLDGASASLNEGITLVAGQTWSMDAFSFTTGAVTGVSNILSGGATVAIQEWQ